MAGKFTAETEPYKPGKGDALKTGSKASYTPNSAVNEHGYGRSGGRAAALGKVPEVVVGGSSEVGVLPAMPGTFRVGEDKNVSTPVSG